MDEQNLVERFYNLCNNYLVCSESSAKYFKKKDILKEIEKLDYKNNFVDKFLQIMTRAEVTESDELWGVSQELLLEKILTDSKVFERLKVENK